jgi:hypothetical protein
MKRRGPKTMKDSNCTNIRFMTDGRFTGGKGWECAYGANRRLPEIRLGDVVMCLSRA